MGVVNLVAILPLRDVTVTVNCTQHFHGTLSVAVRVVKKSFADPSAMAPEDGPEVVHG